MEPRQTEKGKGRSRHASIICISINGTGIEFGLFRASAQRVCHATHYSKLRTRNTTSLFLRFHYLFTSNGCYGHVRHARCTRAESGTVIPGSRETQCPRAIFSHVASLTVHCCIPLARSCRPLPLCPPSWNWFLRGYNLRHESDD